MKKRKETEEKSKRGLERLKGKRLLPGDFNKYLSLEDSEKRISAGSGTKSFFSFPEDLKGVQDIGVRNFLVFYFDEKEDYEIVKRFFEVTSRKSKSHPILDEKKLADLVRAEENK